MTDGKWTLPNGVVYEGKFEFNKPVGDGKFEPIDLNCLCFFIRIYRSLASEEWK